MSASTCHEPWVPPTATCHKYLGTLKGVIMPIIQPNVSLGNKPFSDDLSVYTSCYVTGLEEETTTGFCQICQIWCVISATCPIITEMLKCKHCPCQHHGGYVCTTGVPTVCSTGQDATFQRTKCPIECGESTIVDSQVNCRLDRGIHVCPIRDKNFENDNCMWHHINTAHITRSEFPPLPFYHEYNCLICLSITSHW